MDYAEIVFPVPLAHSFTYEVSPATPLKRGFLVEVPFGRRRAIGVVAEIHQNKPERPTRKVETPLHSEAVVPEFFWEWLGWVSRYYLTPIGEVLASALPSKFFKLRSAKQRPPSIRSSPFAKHWLTEKEIQLNQDQKGILSSLVEQVDKNRFFPSLLFGVTGSGKTEIYLKLLQQVVLKGRSAIFLVPEIGLTPQIVGRFRQVFGEKLALTHSGLTENQRLHEWKRCRDGSARVIVGTRSALFSPFADCGLIVIDEEHDSSYKQEEGFRYHARDLALMRGKIQNSVVLMGSATPSLESFYNARSGKYHLYTLRERAGDAVMPKIRLVDMAAFKRQTKSVLSLCDELHQAIAETLKRKEQVLILINRRGFANSFFCLACEKAFLCPNCSVNLTCHRASKSLLCHYCGYEMGIPQSCPSCASREVTLLGLGTETVEEEIKTWFPKARVARLDRDSAQKKGYLLQTLERLKEGKIDILVGTQMIAKGHDIPGVTLVGVLGIDVGLGLPDFRSAERSYQLLTQVSGRAGRGSAPGRVIVQTFAPNHYSIQCACRGDFEGFFEQELSFRRETGYPPVTRLIQFRFSGTNEKRLADFMRRLGSYLEASMKVHSGPLAGGPAALGPAKAPIEKIRGRFRWQILLKGATINEVQKGASLLASSVERSLPAGVKWAVDVDPLGML
ncbi:MAG: primosomal protein N' [Deltaproteobacteria bacterium]|nr:primosomal protein N' [Deltaproteobacteria bacterium]